MKSTALYFSINGLISFLIFISLAAAEPVNPNNLTTSQQSLLHKPVYGGLSGIADIYIRIGYVLNYNPTTKHLTDAAYPIKLDNRKTLQRKDRLSNFRRAPYIDNEPSTSDDVGLKDARGHAAPYGVMGGDQETGAYAVYNGDDSGPDDERTVFQRNYMTDIAPQHHDGFN